MRRINSSLVQPRSEANPSVCHLTSACASRRLCNACWWRNPNRTAMWAMAELSSLCTRWQGGYAWPLSHRSPLLPKDWHFLAFPQASCGPISKFPGKQREFKALFPGVASSGCPLRLKFQALPFKEHLLQLSQPQLFWELAPLLNLDEFLLPYREGNLFSPPSPFCRFVWNQSSHFFFFELVVLSLIFFLDYGRREGEFVCCVPFLTGSLVMQHKNTD